MARNKQRPYALVLQNAVNHFDWTLLPKKGQSRAGQLSLPI
jgi:hypothetical protein